ncbi:MAG: hypothetical protein Ta2E_03300 [Mycoplasmoidaceae bacterium]|nr:MAG: hypothetical protein Ta2E_03300 [Mycoplasmoidaceae bacterium]
MNKYALAAVEARKKLDEKFEASWKAMDSFKTAKKESKKSGGKETASLNKAKENLNKIKHETKLAIKEYKLAVKLAMKETQNEIKIPPKQQTKNNDFSGSKESKKKANNDKNEKKIAKLAKKEAKLNAKETVDIEIKKPTKKIENQTKSSTTKIFSSTKTITKHIEGDVGQTRTKKIVEKRLSSDKEVNEKIIKYPSRQLSIITGKDPVTCFEAVKQVWTYVKKNELQDLKDKILINTDETLRSIFGKDQISSFEMAKIISKNLFDKPWVDNIITIIHAPKRLTKKITAKVPTKKIDDQSKQPTKKITSKVTTKKIDVQSKQPTKKITSKVTTKKIESQFTGKVVDSSSDILIKVGIEKNARIKNDKRIRYPNDGGYKQPTKKITSKIITKKIEDQSNQQTKKNEELTQNFTKKVNVPNATTAKEQGPKYKTIITKKASSDKSRDKKIIKYPSRQLSIITGKDPITCFEAVKQVWTYVKENELQDLKDKILINTDETLRSIFGKDQISSFEMAKIISKNLFDEPWIDNIVTVVQIPPKNKSGSTSKIPTKKFN